MKHLFFGGTFNPIHFGHILAARVAAEECNFDKVVLIPTGVPYHKENSGHDGKVEQDYYRRLKMCRVAVAGDPLFEVSDIEKELAYKNEKSYTIDTVKKLKSAGFENINWLVGADCAYQLDTWHEFDELRQNVHFVIYPRGEVINWAAMESWLTLKKINGTIVPGPMNDLSSSLIRQRVATNRSIRYLVPDEVAKQIYDNKLYTSEAKAVI
jgi:nicotinate-nucleotide adenylyltransferase